MRTVANRKTLFTELSFIVKKKRQGFCVRRLVVMLGNVLFGKIAQKTMTLLLCKTETSTLYDTLHIIGVFRGGRGGRGPPTIAQEIFALFKYR